MKKKRDFFQKWNENGTNQTHKLLHSQGNHKQNETTTYRMGENVCKWCDFSGLNFFQNMQTAYTTP